ncbi:MAG TPA: D-alanyl-D-alanine endopeptidase [Steroidobacteraceae bacterium]|nr:D-alanyl-D-alanine endopeptidase [Steroidobacteraceae bacterium]
MNLQRVVSIWVLVQLVAIPLAMASGQKRAHDGPDLRSSSALVLDVTHSTVLYSRNADTPLPIASITKLMTALVVVDANLPLDETLQVTDADRAHGKGTFSRLAVGTKLTRGELMHLALMSSENRAANVLGREYPGGTPAFVRAMNAKAKALGMTRSRFVDPAGLSSQNVASPRDLARLVAAAAKNETIRRYSTDRAHAVKVGRQMIEFRNTNTLVGNPDWDIIVQKTGYISEAGRCLVMQAVVDGREVLIVLLNSFGKYTRVADARRIRKWMATLPAEPDSRITGGAAGAVRTRS